MLAGHGPGHGQLLRGQSHSSSSAHSYSGAQSSITWARLRSHQCRVRTRIARKACNRFICRTSSFSRDEEDEVSSFREGVRLPTQGESLVKGVDTPGLQLQERERDDGPPDFMFLSVRL